MTQLITMPRAPGADDPELTARRIQRRSGRAELLAVFAVAAVAYLAVGGYLAAKDVAFADAYSRVANGMYVLYSRDPHLPALGFVWNPLPSLAVLPLLSMHSVFPGLLDHAFAGVIQSALCMAGTVAVLGGCLRKLGVATRASRLVLVALFAVQPMIVFYAGSGQSEAMLLLTLALTTSALLSWVTDGRPGQLIAAGLALGLAYLTRYEGAAAALAVTVFVVGRVLVCERGPAGRRLTVVANAFVLVAGPFLVVFGLWAAASRVLVGEWFPTFSSQYGNTAQVSAMSSWIDLATGTGPAAKLAYVVRQTWWMAPAVVPLLLVVLVLAVRARSATLLVAPMVFGGVAAFTAVASVLGSSFVWFRFQISLVPLAVLLAGSVVGAASARRGSLRTGTRTAAAALVAVTLVGVAAGGVTQAIAMTSPTLNLAREEAPMVRALLLPDDATDEERSYLHLYDSERQISASVDAMNLPDGSVLGDSAYIYPMLLDTDRQQQYVITSDRDFDEAVADPAGFGIRYILVSSIGTGDAVQRAHPGLFADGAGIATLVGQWDGYRLGTWRLYRVN